MARADFRFAYRKRVRYSETDVQAVVFNARYLDYLDIGVTEYLRAVGMADPTGLDGLNQFLIAHSEIDYRASMRLDEEIDICIRLARAGRTSLTYAFEFHGRDGDDLRAKGETVQVHVGTIGGSPCPVPADFLARLETYEGRPLRA
jgi:acyl-CoA thioester hydrolase